MPVANANAPDRFLAQFRRWRGIRMSTKRTIFCMSVIGGLIPLFLWVGGKTGSSVFTVLGIILSFASIGLLSYAAFREKAHDDKSERVSPRTAAMILCVVGLWVIFVFYRALIR